MSQWSSCAKGKKEKNCCSDSDFYQRKFFSFWRLRAVQQQKAERESAAEWHETNGVCHVCLSLISSHQALRFVPPDSRCCAIQLSAMFWLLYMYLGTYTCHYKIHELSSMRVLGSDGWRQDRDGLAFEMSDKTPKQQMMRTLVPGKRGKRENAQRRKSMSINLE